MDIPVFEIEINEDEFTGVGAVSFVSDPAIEEDFIALNKNDNFLRFQADNYKQIVTGPALVPNKEIFRLSEEGPYFIKFTADVIEEIAKKFFKQGFTLNTNQEHSDKLFKDNVIFESWIITDENLDKSKALGFSLPVGTWMLSVHIKDEEYFKNEILSGNRKGFSIEGFFILKETFNKTDNKMSNEKKTLFNKVMDALKPLFLQDDECTDCGGPGSSEELGSNISRLLNDAIEEIVNREDNPIPRAEIVSRIAEEAGIEESTVNGIIAGDIQCPPLERVMGIARAFPNLNLDEVEAAWEADGCAAPEEEEDMKEEPAEQKEDLSAIVEKLQAEVSAIKEELEAAKAETVKAQEALTAAQADNEAKDKEIKELLSTPAAKPITDKPTGKTETQEKELPFHKQYLANVIKFSKKQ